MKYIVYQTTNLVNQKIYIGVHGTAETEFDGYLGSGKLIMSAIQKHGKNNFTRKTLFEYVDEKLAYDKEMELVNLEFISRLDTYNVALGGKTAGARWKKNHLYARNSDGELLYLKNDDPRYLSGEYTLVGSKKGLVRMVLIITGENKEFSVDIAEEMKNFGWAIWSSGMMRYFDKNNKQYYLKTNDPLIEHLQLSAWTKNMKVMKLNGKVIHVNKNDVTDEMTSIVKDTVTVKDEDGNNFRVSKTDPRYLNGQLVGVNKGRKGMFDHMNAKIYKCKYCDMVTNKSNISRWHNEKCKQYQL